MNFFVDLRRTAVISEITNGGTDASRCFAPRASGTFIYSRAFHSTFDYEWKAIAKRRFIIHEC